MKSLGICLIGLLLASPARGSVYSVTVAGLVGEGLDVHGQISHPDPYAAVMQTIDDERVDEIIVSTFPEARSGWLRRDLIQRLRDSTKLPIEHVEVDAPAEVTA